MEGKETTIQTDALDVEQEEGSIHAENNEESETSETDF